MKFKEDCTPSFYTILNDYFYSLVSSYKNYTKLVEVFNPINIFLIFNDEKSRYLFIVPDVQYYLNRPTFEPLKTLYFNGVLSWSNIDLRLSSCFSDTYNSCTDIFSKVYSDVVSNQFDLNRKAQDFDSLKDVIPGQMWSPRRDTLEFFEVISINIDNSMYAYLSLPPVKLYYPEPYVASPSFQHEEVWFVHILHYQHILWMCFISLIMFYFVVFINTVRYCNPRIKPKRETRGVSRSKCADLITACVPVSWALSIIISESVDATDYYDGFGTGEVVIGIRAYQWGWEYFFPKNMDLNYNVSPSYSSVTGNSLKYAKYSSSSTKSVFFWKNMNTNSNVVKSLTPTHAILSPSDNSKILNFIDLNAIGDNNLSNLTSFRNCQLAYKFNKSSIFESHGNYNITYSKLSDNYVNTLLTQNNHTYGITRQHNYSSLNSTLNNSHNTLDSKSVDLLLNYNADLDNLNTDVNSNNYSKDLVLNQKKFNNVTNKSYLANIKSQTYNPVNLIQSRMDSKNEEYYNADINNYNKLFLGISDYSKLKPTNSLWTNFHIKSPEQIILMSEKNLRNSLNINPNTATLDLLSKSTNSDYKLGNSTFSVINSAATTFTYPHSPTNFLGFKNANVNYDKYTSNNQNPRLLEDKNPKSLAFPFETLWENVWSHQNNLSRYVNNINFVNSKKNIVVPSITEYLDYDFRNWQQLSQLEDFFWESTFSDSEQSNYENLLYKIKKNNKFSEFELPYNDDHRYKIKPQKKPSLSNLISLYSPEFYLNTKSLTLNNFNIFDNEIESEDNPQLYVNNKVLNYLFYKTHLNTLNIYSYSLLPLPYTQVMNMFRSNFDESFNTQSSNTTDLDVSDDVNLLNAYEDVRTYNSLKLRKTTKAAIKYFDAIQKVFNIRFTENRSNTSSSDFSINSIRYPFLSGSRVNYNSLLGKNKESYFDTILYKNTIVESSPLLNSIIASSNIYFTNIPFLIGMRSDPIRYIWFDHQSRWASLEVQPSSVARYSLIGLPYIIKNFEFSSKYQKTINESENYNLRLSKARKNYISNWSTSPFLYSRLSSWYGNTSFKPSSIQALRLNLELSNFYWKKTENISLYRNVTPSYNDVSTPGRSSWKPTTNLGSYMYNLSTLSKLLSKREYLYTEYFLNKGYSLKLPNYLKSTPTNSLFIEIQRSYKFTDPSNFLNEISRDFYYSNAMIKNFLNLQFFLTLNDTFILGKFINNMFYYFIDPSSYFNTSNINSDIYKNQFRPMKKGISNMIRLHATGAIALPTETRLHILASSRDIIHSWAIPSAGIKIDCIPGYSSHRVAIFLTSGIFWGQCMEICGRFHHWMPIVLYFVRRDIFVLWVTHFIYLDINSRRFKSSNNDLLLKPLNVDNK